MRVNFFCAFDAYYLLDERSLHLALRLWFFLTVHGRILRKIYHFFRRVNMSGIVNIRSTCYVNSLLQAFSSLDAIVDALRAHRTEHYNGTFSVSFSFMVLHSV